MHHMYDTQYANRDVTKYKYAISLLHSKSLVHTLILTDFYRGMTTASTSVF